MGVSPTSESEILLRLYPQLRHYEQLTQVSSFDLDDVFYLVIFMIVAPVGYFKDTEKDELLLLREYNQH